MQAQAQAEPKAEQAEAKPKAAAKPAPLAKPKAKPQPQGSNGEGGKERKREQEGGTFRVAGELLFLTREGAEAHLREASGGRRTGTTGMTGMPRGTRVVTRRRGVIRGVRWGVTRGVRRKGTWGVRRGVPGGRMSPGNPPTTQEG